MTNAKRDFDAHLTQCDEAFEIYIFLKVNGYIADFSLRYVWVALVSALDDYITQLIVEKSTEHFANGIPFSPKLRIEGVPVSNALTLMSCSPAQAIVEFRSMIANSIRYRTFQKADDVADGLAYIWNEQHKWNAIAKVLRLDPMKARYTLNSISSRRDRIVHNADFDEASSCLTNCSIEDAREATQFIRLFVSAIDTLIP